MCGLDMSEAWLLAPFLVLVTSCHHAPTLAAISSTGVQKALVTTRFPRCDPQEINVTANQGPFPGWFNYTVKVKNPYACVDERIYLESVKESSRSYRDGFKFKAAGEHCYMEKGLYSLKMGEVMSNNFSLNGLELFCEGFIFLSDSEAQVKFHRLPPWVSQLDLQVKDMEGNIAGRVISKETLIIIPGNYTINNLYRLMYLPVVYNSSELKCKEMSYALPCEDCMYKQQTTGPPLDDNKTAVMLIAILGVCCLCTGLVVITTFSHTRTVNQLTCLLPSYHNTRGTRSESRSLDSPLITTQLPTDRCQISPCVGNVLLVHAADTPELMHFCKNLKATIIKCCSRKVLDITVRDVQRMESPETWLLQVLSQQDTTVLLVMSPVLAALHRSIQPNDSAACEGSTAAVKGRMQAWDNLLRECLRFLQERLALNYTRLLIVAKSQRSLRDDIPELVPDKRYLLPRHQQELLNALGSCHA
ncbi:uncharacterized protein LOC135113650 isoform X1 [Scylla paramamosain]|uniref:uncharacterized protein LOC135113650 isoform X1 n=1 Tax=Scylla paramamosain TaxID=85552 RepID=UPI003082DF45